MKRRLLVLLFFTLTYVRLTACGYAFVGGCSTDISLRINGTEGLFAIATCASELAFDGLQMGEISSLHLVKARAITWESCQNNVSSVQLRYRIWPLGQPSGTWQEIDLTEIFDTLGGPYTTRYREEITDIDLSSGLTTGQDYIIEAYFYAQVDTLGDDFVPETFMLQDNNGINYRAQFRYGGSAAPPLVAITTVKQDVRCHGDSTGAAEIRVFGAQSDLFYQWSYQTQNFFTHFDLPAGSYTVTATESVTNFSVIRTFDILQPDDLSAIPINIVGLDCGGLSPAEVSLMVTGGMPPYGFSWSNGDTTAVLETYEAGVYTVLVVDGNQCAASASVQIEPVGLQSIQIDTLLCAGEFFTFLGQTIDSAGTYALTLPGLTGCDTLITLTVQVVDLSAAFNEIPDTARITCNEPLLSLCAGTLAEAQYAWNYEGQEFSVFPCVALVQPGLYALSVSKNIDGKWCHLAQPVVVIDDFEPPVITGVSQSSLCDGWVSVACQIEGGTPPYTAEWSAPELSGTSVTAQPGYYFVAVSGANGCFDQATILVEDFHLNTQSQPASGPTQADGEAQILVSGAVNAPYQIDWDNGQSGNMISNLLPGWYCATVTDQTECTRDTCVYVDFVSTQAQPIFQTSRLFISPNPAVIGDALQMGHFPEPVWIALYDVQNRRVFQTQSAAGDTMIQLPPDLRQGMYFFQVRGRDFWAVEKIFLLFNR